MKFLYRLRLISVFLFVGLLTTACFDLEEEISLNKNGSGRYTTRIDMSQLVTMIQAMGGDAQEMQEGMNHSMDSTLQDMRDKLAGIEGISQVTTDMENNVFAISYNFANVEALNLATGKSDLAGSQSGMNLDMGDVENFAFSKGKFSRADAPLDQAMAQMEESGDDQSMDMARMMMGDAGYTLIYHFPGQVKSMTNERATLSADRKTVRLNANFIDLMDGSYNIGNDIRFK